MNCLRIQKLLTTCINGAIPPVIQEHIDGCPTCRGIYEQGEAVRRLLSLKRYEKPDSGVGERCVANVRKRIERLNNVPEKIIDIRKFLDRLTGNPTPILRYAAAAVFVMIFAMNMSSLWVLPSLQPVAWDLPAPSYRSRYAGPLAGSSRDDNRGVTMSMMQSPSNRSPMGVQYGPGPSTPVKFDY